MARVHTTAIDHLCRADKTLGRLIKKVGPCGLRAERNGHPHAPFAALVRAVAHQQLAGSAANAILGRFLALFPKDRFPSPEQLLAEPEERLRAVGFSRAKVAALRDIAAKTVEGVVPGHAPLGSWMTPSSSSDSQPFGGWDNGRSRCY